MKRTHTYEINHAKKMVTVTRAFMEEATQYNSKEFKLMMQFERLGLRVVQQKRTVKPRTEESKPRLLTYKMMKAYIAMLDDAEDMMSEFETLCSSVKKCPDRLKKVNNWFRETFPNYDAVPEFDEEYRIVHNPNAAAWDKEREEMNYDY